jgi:protease-4
MFTGFSAMHEGDSAKIEQIDQATLVAELLKERKRDRRAGVLKSAFFVAATLAYIWYWSSLINPGAQGDFDASKPYASVVKISGVIGPDSDASYESIAPLLKKAFEDPISKGVVLDINSPGGTPVQASLIHDYILDLKARTHKPVIAVGEDMMTSGAYMIAVAADQLTVNRSTVTGSVGVISSGFGFTGIMDKLGIERRVATAGKSKNLLDPFSPQTDDGRAKQREILTAIHGHFIDMVKAGRGARLKLDTPGLFEGTVWTGEDAVKLGVVDELGDIRHAAQKYIGAEQTVTVASRKPMLQSLLSKVGVKVLSSAIDSAVQTPAETPMATYQ